MPDSSPVGRPFTTKTAVDANRRRWQRDRAGIDKYVKSIIARWPAVSAEQRTRIACLLTDPNADHAG